MMLEMPDVETEEQRKAKKKAAQQARAHKKWRESEKGRAWKAAYRLTAKAKADQQKTQQERKKPTVNEPTSGS